MTTTPTRSAQDIEPRTIKAAQDGEQWAWETIYGQLAGPVTGYLRQHGASDPEDLSSEVFYQIARDIHRFKGNGSKFRSWVFVIAHRRLIDSRRAEGRKPHTVNQPVGDLDTPGGNVEEEVMEHLSTSQMRQVFDTLTEDQKRVLALRIIADFSLEDTASLMGKRVGAVKALQRRALATVEARLREGRVTL